MPSTDTATTEIYTLSLHDALPISRTNRRSCSSTSPRRGSTWSCGATCGASCARSEEHTSELQSRGHLVCLLLTRRQPKSTLFPYTTLFRSRARTGDPVPRRAHGGGRRGAAARHVGPRAQDRKSTRLNSSHVAISYAFY